MKAELTIKS